MKFMKFIALVALSVGGIAFYQSSHAQQMQPQTTSNVALIKTLLSLEINENPLYADNRESIQYTLDNSGEEDLVGPDCPMYAPMLVHAVNQNALFDTYYNIQGNFGYKFAFVENDKPKLVNYNFYDQMGEGGSSGKLITITVAQARSLNNMEGTPALKYIVDDICTPLNRFLAQNAGAAPADILAKMRLYFTK